MTIGWAVAQSPYMLPTDLTFDEAAASDATLTASLIAVAVGAVLLVPSLYLLYSLVLQGQARPELRAARPALPADHRRRQRRGGADGEEGRAHAC